MTNLTDLLNRAEEITRAASDDFYGEQEFNRMCAKIVWMLIEVAKAAHDLDRVTPVALGQMGLHARLRRSLAALAKCELHDP